MSKLAYALRDDYEPELEFIPLWIGKNSIAVDVGAHYGSWTVALGALCSHVHAIEPSRHARNVLSRNLDLNQISNVTIYAMAAGERPEFLRLKNHEDRSRASLRAISDVDGKEGELVAVQTIDSLYLGHVDFIKVDVEGFESCVLRGAAGTISKCFPAILFEIQSSAALKAGFGVWDAYLFLEKLGYSFLQVSKDRRWLRIERTSELREGNVLAIRFE